MTLGEDTCRVRKDNAAANPATLRRYRPHWVQPGQTPTPSVRIRARRDRARSLGSPHSAVHCFAGGGSSAALMRWPWQRMPSRDCATGDGAWPCASIRLVLPPEWPRPMPGVRHGTCTPPATAREVFQTTAAQGWPAAAGLPATGPGPASARIRSFAHGDGLRRVHRHGGDAVLGRAVDEFVRVGQVDQRVAPGIDHAHDAQALEQYRHAFAGHLLLLT